MRIPRLLRSLLDVDPFDVEVPDVAHMTLTRYAHTPDGVLGRLGRWYTLENPWEDNRPRVSCIPAGTYLCRRDFFHAGGYPAFEITGVPDRSRILIHIGNRQRDTAGCPLVGANVGVLGGELAVLASRAAYNDFMASLADTDEWELEIRDVDGTSVLQGETAA